MSNQPIVYQQAPTDCGCGGSRAGLGQLTGGGTPFPPGGQFPGGQFPGGMLPGGQFPGGMFPGGQFPGGMFPGGQFPGGQFPGGQFPGGQFPGGMFPGGQFPGGQFPGGQFPGGQFPGGMWPQGQQPGMFPLGLYPGGEYPQGTFPGQFPGGMYPYQRFVPVVVKGGHSFPEVTWAYNVPYRDGLTIFQALLETGAVRFGLEGQLQYVDGIEVDASRGVQTAILLNGRTVSEEYLAHRLQPGDELGLELLA
ncbi:hypothetical protein [uncultured Paenibacillus sp.]|uniref:hypothetical protein n=1 Tax=uncultured Paenibacillus sp. TaxID=227322 RepID=UPI0028D8F006|nr:hypothetical protein [uncultured Paenibacillus sp.]